MGVGGAVGAAVGLDAATVGTRVGADATGAAVGGLAVVPWDVATVAVTLVGGPAPHAPRVNTSAASANASGQRGTAVRSIMPHPPSSR
jgi:hypothetical protein